LFIATADSGAVSIWGKLARKGRQISARREKSGTGWETKGGGHLVRPALPLR